MIIRVYKAKSDGSFSTVPLGYLTVCTDAMGNLDVNKTLEELKNSNYIYGDIEGQLAIRNVPNTKSAIYPGLVYVVFDVKRKTHLRLVEVKKPPPPAIAFNPHDYFYTTTSTGGLTFGGTSTATNVFTYTFTNNTNNR